MSSQTVPSTMGSSFGRRLALLVLTAVLAACASAPPPEVKAALSPTGVLRVAVYPGSPTSLVAEAPAEQQRGLTVDVGREMARRLGVPVRMQVYPRVAEVLAALQRGDADITITNATSERQVFLDFAPTMVSLELGVLVRNGVSLKSVDEFDALPLKVGVSQGSSSQRTLEARLKNAQVVPQPTLQAAAAALRAGTIDAFATNKAILFELSAAVPGSRILEGRWGLEHLALGTGKGREVGMAWLKVFNDDIVAEGLVARAADRAGLKGLSLARGSR